MKSTKLSLIITTLLVCCGSPAARPYPTEFTATNVIDLRLTRKMDDSPHEEVMTFRGSGWVAMILPCKEMVTFPAYQWNLEGNELVVYKDGNLVLRRLTVLEWGRSQIRLADHAVKRNGAILAYNYIYDR